MLDRRRSFMSQCENAGIEDPKEFIKDLYVSGKSCQAINEILLKKYKIVVSTKRILDDVKASGVLRTPSESKKLAIKTGRMVYKKNPAAKKALNDLLLFVQENSDPTNTSVALYKITDYVNKYVDSK